MTDAKRERPMYLLLSRHYSTKGACVWWRPNSNGYTWDIDQAGRYTEEEARSLECNGGAGGNIVIAVPESALAGVLIARVVSDEHAHHTFKRFEVQP